MRNYIRLKEFLQSLHLDIDTTRENILDIAISEIKERIWKGEINSFEEYCTELRQEVDAVLDDPNFDWLKVMEEVNPAVIVPDLRGWPYNYSDGLLQEFKAVTFDFLYPERKISREDLSQLKQVVVFLLMEVKGNFDWVSYSSLLKQLRSMKTSWLFLETHHLEELRSYSSLTFKQNDLHYKIIAVRLDRDRPDYEKSIERIENLTEGYNNPYAGWPPFQTDPSAPYYLKYDKQAWLNIINQEAGSI